LKERYRKGRVVAFEGIDGSGKNTQAKLLGDALCKAGWPVEVLSFPQYEKTFFGRMVGRYLAGKFGVVGKVNPYFVSFLYAADRWQAAGKIRRWLAEGKIVLADRYAGSNAAYQAANLSVKRRRRFLAWLDTLEFRIFKIPREDLTILLLVTPEVGQELVGKKQARGYLKGAKQDIHEKNLDYLRRASDTYRKLASERDNWVVIDCTDGAGGIRSVESIHQDVLAVLGSRLGIEV